MKMKLDQAVGIAMNDSAPASSNHDAQAGFLKAFSLDGCKGLFTGLALAAGKLPVPGVNRLFRALPHQETAVAAYQTDAHRSWLLMKVARETIAWLHGEPQVLPPWALSACLAAWIARPGEPMML
jgi:hypothetical protein